MACTFAIFLTSILGARVANVGTLPPEFICVFNFMVLILIWDSSLLFSTSLKILRLVSPLDIIWRACHSILVLISSLPSDVDATKQASFLILSLSSCVTTPAVS